MGCRCRCNIIHVQLNNCWNPPFGCAVLLISSTEVFSCVRSSWFCQFIKLHLLLRKPLYALLNHCGNCAHHPAIVVSTGPGNLPKVRDWTGGRALFHSITVQERDLQLLGGANPAPSLSTRGFCRVWVDLSGPISGSAFWIFLFMVTFRYPTVDRKLLIMVLHCHFLMYWQPLYSKQVERRSLPHHETECQWSVYNWWSCIVGNLSGTWSHISINKWLATSMSKWANDIPAIASWTVTTFFI